MGGFGSAQGMINSIKNNSRRKQREAYDGWTDSDTESKGIKVEPVSEEVLEEIRLKMKQQQNKTRVRNVIIVIISVFVFAFLFWAIVSHFQDDPGVSFGPFVNY